MDFVTFLWIAGNFIPIVQIVLRSPGNNVAVTGGNYTTGVEFAERNVTFVIDSHGLPSSQKSGAG